MIFYRSASKEKPAWMPPGTQQQDCTHYYVYAARAPMCWPDLDAEWQDIGTDADGNTISFVQLGSFEPQLRETFMENDVRYIKTPCGSCVPIYPAMDRHGAAWTIPVIVNDGGPTLALQWRSENGTITRDPSPEQQKIINTCEHIRKAALNEGLDSLPLQMAAEAAGLILSYAYHCHESEFIVHGILDDHLVPRVLLAACGLGTPEHQLAAYAEVST